MGTISPRYPVNIENLDPLNVYRNEGLDSPWVNIKCNLYKNVEKSAKFPEGISGKSCTVTYNCRTRKVYLNDSKETLALKLLGLSAMASVGILLLKTLYHVILPLSLGYEIYLKLHKVQQKILTQKKPPVSKLVLTKKILKVIAKNLIDIVKTPLFAVAMIITTLSILALSIFKRELLYEGRVAYGEMLMALNWGKKMTLWSVGTGVCMIPLANLSDKNEKKRFLQIQNVDYEGPLGSDLMVLNNVAYKTLHGSEIKFLPCLD